MSIEILDCLKRKRDICVKAVITSQNTAFMLTPALIGLFCSDFQIVAQFFVRVVFTLTSYFFRFDLHVKKNMQEILESLLAESALLGWLGVDVDKSLWQ